MRKALLVAVAALLLGALGTSFAQITSSVNGIGTSGALVVGGVGSTTASHIVKVNIPVVIMLQIVGKTGASNANVVFNPTANDVNNSLASGGTTIAADTSASGFSQVQGFTNGTSNVSVSVAIANNVAGPDPTTQGTLLNNIELGSTSASATAINGSSSPTQTIVASNKPAWTPLWSLGDFWLHLSGSEVPGTYSYKITYTAAVP